MVRRNNRPLLKGGDPRAVLERLAAERYPVYAEADIIVDTLEGPPEVTLERVVDALYAASRRRRRCRHERGSGAAARRARRAQL